MRPMLACLLASAPLIGCVPLALPGVPGNGTIVKQDREVAEFNELVIRGAFEVALEAGPLAPVRVEGDENLLPLVQTTVADGRLTIDVAPKETIRPSKPITVSVTVPSLKGIHVEGASRLRGAVAEADSLVVTTIGASQADVPGLKVDDLIVKVQGASKATLGGSARKVRLDVEGASHGQLEAMQAEEVVVTIEGASGGHVLASKQVQGKVDGASRLQIDGEVTDIQVKTSGVSKVQRPGSAASK